MARCSGLRCVHLTANSVAPFDPTLLSHLQCDAEHLFYLSTKDAACWFDQLLLLPPLQRWMCKPKVTTAQFERIEVMPIAEQARHVLDGESFSAGAVWPASRVCPMGFAWSSDFVQCQLLHTR